MLNFIGWSNNLLNSSELTYWSVLSCLRRLQVGGGEGECRGKRRSWSGYRGGKDDELVWVWVGVRGVSKFG